MLENNWNFDFIVIVGRNLLNPWVNEVLKNVLPRNLFSQEFECDNLEKYVDLFRFAIKRSGINSQN